MLSEGAVRVQLRRWRSGQSHLTVNQATLVYVGSNPTRRTKEFFL